MLSLLDIAERTQIGPKMAEDQYNINFFRKVSELVKKYEIPNRDPDALSINIDDMLPERAFLAGVELLVENGVYCTSTGRIVKFTRQEVLDALKACPDELVIGAGKDTRVMRQRKVEGKEFLNFCPGAHSPFTEDVGPLVLKNFAHIARADFIEGFNFAEVDGLEIMGTPLEAYAARRQVSIMREAVAKAGRPGLSIALYPISTRSAAMIAALDSATGLRQGDSVLTTILPDLKIEHDLLTANIAYEDRGVWRSSSSYSMAGGFCGGIDGAIIEGVARPLAAMICYHVYVNCVGVEKVAGNLSIQQLSWASSVVSQALNRYSRMICMKIILPKSGPGTETNLLENAFFAIEATIDGCNLHTPRHIRPQMNAGHTPLEAELVLEVSDAVITAGLNRQQAGELLAFLMEKMKGRPSEPGFTIQECYDLVKDKPYPEYEKIYQQVKEQLALLGLIFS